MRRAYAVAALATLGLYAAGSSISLAQNKNDPVRFGRIGRELVYTKEDNDVPFNLIIGGVPPITPENQGKIKIHFSGFELWGVLDGAGFYYARSGIADVLQIERNGTRIRYVDFPSRDYRSDSAEVNGHTVLEKKADFFETAQQSHPPQTTEERLVSILRDYRQKLNVAEAGKRSEALMPHLTQKELQESLDKFIK